MASRGLRIIAGQLRGRRIRVPPDSQVRPTPERVREALFSILGPRLPGACVLDAFAGSGALGLEALSRGADRAVFVEADRRVAAALRVAVAELGLDARAEVVVLGLPGPSGGPPAGNPFDVILADPPYATTGPEGEAALAALAPWLAPEGVLVWERATRSASPAPPALERTRTYRYGNTALDLYAPAPVAG